MICSSCDEAITDDVRADNRYRGCEQCGWRMHHYCWIEHLSDGTLPCPTVPWTWERWTLEPVPGLTPTGRQRTKRVKVLEESFRYVPGHGAVIGMRGEWESG